MITRRGSDSRIIIPGDAEQVRAGGTVFLPTNISGLQTWLDFSDATKLYTDAAKNTPVSSDGDVIGAVEDKSGQGNDATQSTTNLKPLYKTGIQNSLSVGRFDGSNDRLLIATLASAYTIGDVFVVAKTASVNAGYPLTIKDHDGGLGDGVSGAIVNSGFFKYENIIISFDWSGAWGVVRYEIASGTQEVYTNGVSRGTTTEVQTNSNTGVTVGNHQNSSNIWDGALDGDVAEILVYDSALSTADRQFVETYLNNKWSVF